MNGKGKGDGRMVLHRMHRKGLGKGQRNGSEETLQDRKSNTTAKCDTALQLQPSAAGSRLFSLTDPFTPS